jgi:hypothetical protein
VTPRIAIATVVLTLLAGGAAADDEVLPLDARPKLRRSAEILLHVERGEEHQSWIEFHLDHVRTHKRGFAYTREVSFGARELELTVMGPALRHHRFGLAFEVRF